MNRAFLIIIIACCGCVSHPKPCNLERILDAHTDLPEAFDAHRALLMDMMQTIAKLENEAGGYQ